MSYFFISSAFRPNLVLYYRAATKEEIETYKFNHPRTNIGTPLIDIKREYVYDSGKKYRLKQ